MSTFLVVPRPMGVYCGWDSQTTICDQPTRNDSKPARYEFMPPDCNSSYEIIVLTAGAALISQLVDAYLTQAYRDTPGGRMPPLTGSQVGDFFIEFQHWCIGRSIPRDHLAEAHSIAVTSYGAFHVDASGSASPLLDSFGIGSGGEFVVGAFAAYQRMGSPLKIVDQVRESIEIAAERDIYSGRPIHTRFVKRQP